jgi:hypothetical protein
VVVKKTGIKELNIYFNVKRFRNGCYEYAKLQEGYSKKGCSEDIWITYDNQSISDINVEITIDCNEIEELHKYKKIFTYHAEHKQNFFIPFTTPNISFSKINIIVQARLGSETKITNLILKEKPPFDYRDFSVTWM